MFSVHYDELKNKTKENIETRSQTLQTFLKVNCQLDVLRVLNVA